MTYGFNAGETKYDICEKCIHREVCKKRDDLENMVHDIQKLVSYSKYADFTLFVDCGHAIEEKEKK